MSTGSICWHDLTVPNADNVRDFYSAVVGWTAEGHDMGEYEDYVMKGPDGETVSGVCWKQGSNANVPSQWMMYIMVESVTASTSKALELGGQVLDGPRDMGGAQFAVVQDPAGAVFALYGQA